MATTWTLYDEQKMCLKSYRRIGMTTESSKRWMDWYHNKGGKDKVNALRKSRNWMTKKEYEELTK